MTNSQKHSRSGYIPTNVFSSVAQVFFVFARASLTHLRTHVRTYVRTYVNHVGIGREFHCQLIAVDDSIKQIGKLWLATSLCLAIEGFGPEN